MPDTTSERWTQCFRGLVGILALLSALTLVGETTHFCAVWCRDGLGQSMTFLTPSH